VAAPAPAAVARPKPAVIAAKPTPPAEDPDAYVVKRVLPIVGPMKFGTWHWDEAGVPAGPGRIVVTVDIEAQVLSIFRDGYEIGAAVILYGSDDKPTPTGVFHVSQKDADHVSNIYDAPMPYMLRLTNDGISIHGSDVKMGYATHGCVGVPTAFAKKLFGVVRKGDRVIVTNGERLEPGAAIKAA
jgi:lipoprotein-anchoring transpeptidase ErfK/SrfK